MDLPDDWLFRVALALLTAATTFSATVWAVGRTLARDREKAQEERRSQVLDDLLTAVHQASRCFSQDFGQKPQVEQSPKELLEEVRALLTPAMDRAGSLPHWEIRERLHTVGVAVNAGLAALFRGDIAQLHHSTGMVEGELFNTAGLLEAELEGAPRPDWVGEPPTRGVTAEFTTPARTRRLRIPRVHRGGPAQNAGSVD